MSNSELVLWSRKIGYFWNAPIGLRRRYATAWIPSPVPLLVPFQTWCMLFDVVLHAFFFFFSVTPNSVTVSICLERFLTLLLSPELCEIAIADSHHWPPAFVNGSWPCGSLSKCVKRVLVPRTVPWCFSSQGVSRVPCKPTSNRLRALIWVLVGTAQSEGISVRRLCFSVPARLQPWLPGSCFSLSRCRFYSPFATYHRLEWLLEWLYLHLNNNLKYSCERG